MKTLWGSCRLSRRIGGQPGCDVECGRPIVDRGYVRCFGKRDVVHTQHHAYPGAPPQAAFAFGAPGVTVTSITIEADTGARSTRNLPTNTTGEWLLANPPMPGGSLIAALTTSGPVTGSFTVVAATYPPSAFFEPFRCPLTLGARAASNSFTADRHLTYGPTTGTWNELVTVPGPGRMSFVQAVAAAGAVASKPLIQSGTLSVKHAGKIELTIKPTVAGEAALKAARSIKLELTLTFSPQNGRSASNVLGLTLLK